MPRLFDAHAAPNAGSPPPNLTGPAQQIRVDVLRLIAAAKAVVAAAALTDEAARTKAFAAALERAVRIFPVDADQIEKRFAAITSVLTEQPDVNGWTGDRIAEIENDWSDVKASWPTAGSTLEAATVAAATAILELERMSRTIAFVTVPSRVILRLANKRTGEVLNFADEFGAELPDPADRLQMLIELQRQPKNVPGWIRPEDGVIYKASRRQTSRVASAALIGVVAAAPFALLLLGNRLDGTVETLREGLSLQDLIGSYALALVGAVAHLFLAYRRNEQRKMAVLADWGLWINVKQASILVSVATLMAVVVLGAWTLGDIDAQTAVLLGYSADSAFDLLFDRFTAKAGTAQKTLLTRIAPAPAPAAGHAGV